MSNKVIAGTRDYFTSTSTKKFWRPASVPVCRPAVARRPPHRASAPDLAQTASEYADPRHNLAEATVLQAIGIYSPRIVRYSLRRTPEQAAKVAGPVKGEFF